MCHHNPNQSYSKYKSTHRYFALGAYAAIATKPVHQFQICPITPYHFLKLHLGPCSSVAMQYRTDRHTHTDGHGKYTFHLAMPNAKCNQSMSKTLNVYFLEVKKFYPLPAPVCNEAAFPILHKFAYLSWSRLFMQQYNNLVEWNDRLHFSSTKPTLHIVHVSYINYK